MTFSDVCKKIAFVSLQVALMALLTIGASFTMHAAGLAGTAHAVLVGLSLGGLFIYSWNGFISMGTSVLSGLAAALCGCLVSWLIGGLVGDAACCGITFAVFIGLSMAIEVAIVFG